MKYAFLGMIFLSLSAQAIESSDQAKKILIEGNKINNYKLNGTWKLENVVCSDGAEAKLPEDMKNMTMILMNGFFLVHLNLRDICSIKLKADFEIDGDTIFMSKKKASGTSICGLIVSMIPTGSKESPQPFKRDGDKLTLLTSKKDKKDSDNSMCPKAHVASMNYIKL